MNLVFGYWIISSFDAPSFEISVNVWVLSCGNELFNVSAEICVYPRVWRAFPNAEVLDA